MNKLIKKILDEDIEEVEQETYVEAKDPSTDELLSEEINDIISHKPQWMVRHGVSSIGIVLLLLILSSWFIPYPDKINAPIQIVAKSEDRKFYGEIILANAELAKVSLGAPVTVEVENYPSAKFGYVHGKVSRISRLSSGDRSVMHVSFVDNYNKEIFLQGTMKGKAKVGNQKKPLLEKLFGNAINK